MLFSLPPKYQLCIEPLTVTLWDCSCYRVETQKTNTITTVSIYNKVYI